MLVRVLLAMNGAALLSRVRRILPRSDVLQSAVPKGSAFWESLQQENVDLVVVDFERLPEPADRSVETIRALPDRPDVVVLVADEEPERHGALLAAGCVAVIPTSLENSALRSALGSIIERRRERGIERIETRLHANEARLSDFVSTSPAMQKFLGVVRRVAASDSSLLILGETGVGKEWLARGIHAESPRAGGPFVAVNCGALPEALVESQLFGHEEGAFTGATRPVRGHFELAHGGTVFLDEIGELPPPAQVKLLRVLQERELRRLGSERSIQVDVRVLAATNRDIEEEVARKRFRQDLFYRLGVVSLTIPPLRERPEDIPDLLDDYLERFRVRFGADVEGYTDAARSALGAYSWPGNVRELVNVIERAVLLCEGERIDLPDLPDVVASARSAEGGAPGVAGDDIAGWEPLLGLPLRAAKREIAARFEKAYLEALLTETGGRIGETAKRAGIQTRSLFEKMRAHGLRKEDFRPKPGAG